MAGDIIKFCSSIMANGKLSNSAVKSESGSEMLSEVELTTTKVMQPNDVKVI